MLPFQIARMGNLLNFFTVNCKNDARLNRHRQPADAHPIAESSCMQWSAKGTT